MQRLGLFTLVNRRFYNQLRCKAFTRATVLWHRRFFIGVDSLSRRCMSVHYVTQHPVDMRSGRYGTKGSCSRFLKSDSGMKRSEESAFKDDPLTFSTIPLCRACLRSADRSQRMPSIVVDVYQHNCINCGYLLII